MEFITSIVVSGKYIKGVIKNDELTLNGLTSEDRLLPTLLTKYALNVEELGILINELQQVKNNIENAKKNTGR